MQVIPLILFAFLFPPEAHAPQNGELTFLVSLNEEKKDFHYGFTVELRIFKNAGWWQGTELSIPGRDFALLKDTGLKHRYYIHVLKAIRSAKIGEPVPPIQIRSTAFFAVFGKVKTSPKSVTFTTSFHDLRHTLRFQPKKSVRITKEWIDILNNPKDPNVLVKSLGEISMSNPRKVVKTVTVQKEGENVRVSVCDNGEEVLSGRTKLSLKNSGIVYFSRQTSQKKMSVSILRWR